MSGGGSSTAHSALVDSVLLKIGALNYARCWKRIVGTFYRVRFDERGKVTDAIAVKVGVEGEADIEVIVRRWDGAGIRGALECKTGNAVQSAEQKNYQRMLENMGGFYYVVRTAEEALEHVERERMRGKL